MTLYDGHIINAIQKAYEKATKNYSVYQIDGSLLDSMIFIAPNCKTTILKEHYTTKVQTNYWPAGKWRHRKSDTTIL